MFWHPGYAPIWFHLITDFLSLAVGVWYYSYLNKKKNIERDDLTRIFILIGAALGALVGSRLIAALEHPDLFFNPPSWLYYYSVKTVSGGIAGGILGVEIAKYFLKIKNSIGDLMVGPIALGIIIGRVGCFMVGLRDGTVGLPSNLPWAIDQGDGILRHPTSLYEILFIAAIWMILSSYKKLPKEKGVCFRIFCISYFLFRFFIEFIKPVHPLFLGITAIQWTSLIVVFVYGLSILKILRIARRV